MAHDVFVSHSSKDSAWAEAVCSTLEANGIRCWIAPRDIPEGMEYPAALSAALSASRVFVLIYSSESNESPQVQREVERTVAHKIPIIPFRIENVPLSQGMDYLISTSQWLDATSPNPEKNLAALVPAVQKWLASSATSAPGKVVVPKIPKLLHAHKRLRRLQLGVTAAVLIGLATGGWLFFTAKAHALNPADTVVLADFANSTGDAIFDDTLKQGLSVQLMQSPFLNILPDQKLRETLKLMGRPADERLVPDVARDLCLRVGSKAYLSGSIANLGSAYVIGIKAVNCQTGGSLAQEQVTSDSKEHVLKALDDAATKLREKVGESLSTVQKFDIPLEQATTPSLEALKALSQARKAQAEKGDLASIPFWKRAIELDPKFALAHAGLGVAYSNLGQNSLARECTRKAYELRETTSELEKLIISAEYYTNVTGELEKALQTYDLWNQEYPRHSVAHANAGLNYSYLGQFEKAAAETVDAIRLDPDLGPNYANLASYYGSLGRFEDAKKVCQDALARKLDGPFLRLIRYGLGFLEGDSAEMRTQVEWATGKAGTEDFIFSFESDTAAFGGHAVKAREFSAAAIDSARRNGLNETAALWQVNSALREAEFGNIERARKEVPTALALASTQDVRILAAVALARAGEIGKARAMADDFGKRFPTDTVINGYWLPTIRAAIELNRRNPARAVEYLNVAVPYEFGQPMPQFEYGGQLYPAFLRGQAYLQMRRSSEAAREFQKFIDHRNVVANCPLGALAHLGLARAYALQGDAAKARAAYQDFFALWKDADPDIPILKQATAEYAKVK